MTNFPTSNMLMNHQSILLPIKFNLTWFGDKEIKQLMLDYYLTQDMAFPDEALMTKKIQNKADLIGDFWNKIYELTKIQYDPIENYDRYEDIEDIGSSSAKSSTTSDTNAFEYPMQAAEKKQIANSNGTGTGSSNATNTNRRKAHLHGNIGVTTSQQMLESEIELQKELSLLKQHYIEQFESFFMFVM